MRSVIVTAHDYNDLKLVHTVRRLYQYSATSMSTKEKQDLARRWSEAYKVCIFIYAECIFVVYICVDSLSFHTVAILIFYYAYYILFTQCRC